MSTNFTTVLKWLPMPGKTEAHKFFDPRLFSYGFLLWYLNALILQCLLLLKVCNGHHKCEYQVIIDVWLLKKIYLFFYAWVFYMYPYMPEEGIRSYYRWLWTTMWLLELNSGPLEEQLMLLTAEHSLQPSIIDIWILRKIIANIKYCV